MTRQNRINCPACGKIIARLGEHWRQSHPDIDPGEYGVTLGIQDQPPTSGFDPSEATAVAPEAPAEPVGPAGVADLPPADLPAAPVDYASVLGTFTDVIRELRANNQALQAHVLKLEQDQAEFQQSVAGHLNRLPDYVDRALTGRLDQMAAEYQGQAQGAALPDGEPGQPLAANPAAAMAANAKMALLAQLPQLLPVIIQKLLTPTPPPVQDAFTSFFKQMEAYESAMAMMQQRQEAVARPMIRNTLDTLSFALKAGAGQADVAAAVDSLRDRLKSEEPKPA
jgi:hypothetical protein